jgi:hypothetical protein
MIDECGAVGGMGIGNGNGSPPKKSPTISVCSPHIPHDLT